MRRQGFGFYLSNVCVREIKKKEGTAVPCAALLRKKKVSFFFFGSRYIGGFSKGVLGATITKS